jgi:AbrB family looped-hinge helix DNA binding protein
MDVHITSKGQVTIPQAIRERYGFMPETDIEFIEMDGWIGIRRIEVGSRDGIDKFLDRLSGSGSGVLTTDEVMELSRGYSDDD